MRCEQATHRNMKSAKPSRSRIGPSCLHCKRSVSAVVAKTNKRPLSPAELRSRLFCSKKCFYGNQNAVARKTRETLSKRLAERLCMYCRGPIEWRSFDSEESFRERKTCSNNCYNQLVSLMHRDKKGKVLARATLLEKLKKRITKSSCERCGTKRNLQYHHLNHDYLDNRPKNISILCQKCHLRHHSVDRAPISKLCFICDDHFFSQGFCSRHYNAWMRHKRATARTKK